MAIGLAVSKSELDSRAGELARGFQKQFGDVLTLKGFLDTKTESDLTAMGYTAQEVAVLKTAMTDLFTLASIWSGQASQTSPYDFRQFVRQLWGVGSF